MTSRDDAEALVLRLPVRPSARSTAIAALALAIGGLGSGAWFLIAGYPLVGSVVLAWSAYVLPGWWRALHRATRGPEVLRMDDQRVTVSHGKPRGADSAWSVAWPQVRSLTVHEIPVPEALEERLGPVTKVLTIGVVDHREVEGPDDHRERLLRWALLSGTTTSRTRLQVFLAMLGPEAAPRVTTWMAANRPEIPFEVNVTGAGDALPQRLPSRVAVLAGRRGLRAELVARIAQMGLNPQVIESSGADALTADLRTCTVAVAVDTDVESLAEASARAGLDRVLMGVTRPADPAPLLDSDRAWTLLDLEEAATPTDGSGDDVTIADAITALLADKDSLLRQWRVGPDGIPVAVGPRA